MPTIIARMRGWLKARERPSRAQPGTVGKFLVAIPGFARRLAGTLDPASDGGKCSRMILEEARRLEPALGEMEKRKGG